MFEMHFQKVLARWAVALLCSVPAWPTQVTWRVMNQSGAPWILSLEYGFKGTVQDAPAFCGTLKLAALLKNPDADPAKPGDAYKADPAKPPVSYTIDPTLSPTRSALQYTFKSQGAYDITLFTPDNNLFSVVLSIADTNKNKRVLRFWTPMNLKDIISYAQEGYLPGDKGMKTPALRGPSNKDPYGDLYDDDYVKFWPSDSTATRPGTKDIRQIMIVRDAYPLK